MNNQSLLRLSVLLPLAAALIGLVLLLVDPALLQSLRNNMFDQYQRWSPRANTDHSVRIIDIDDESLTRLGQWPWPRKQMAEIVDKLHAAEAAAIGFDVVFAEADRTTPRAMLNLWTLDNALRNELEALPDYDQLFVQSIQKAPVVLGFAVQRESPDGEIHPSTRPFRYVYAGPPPDRWLHSFQSAILARAEFENAASGNGALNFVPDSDGVIRRIPLLLRVAGESVPSLDAEVLRVTQGEKNYILKTRENGQGISEIRIGRYRIPTTENGEVWMHYAPHSPERYLPAWKLLAGQIPKEQLQGKMILVGSSAQGLMDLRFSPLGRILPGVEAHAQLLEQISSGHILQRPAWAKLAEIMATLAGCLLIGFIAVRTWALYAAGTTIALLLLLQLGGWYAFSTYTLLINTVTPSLMFAATFMSGSLLHHWMSEREQRWIKQAFSRYVSPNRVSHLIAHPDSMALGGRRQECSFIFTDLADFTSLMESIDPARAVILLNDYLDQMIAIAFKHEGTLDRIVGDAVAIMFSAPVPQADHRARALSCALEMDEFASNYSKELNAKGLRFGLTRIGIHSGEVIVGNFGGSTIFDYRALGDPVNTAARLESVNKRLGTHICLSEATLSGCPNAQTRPIGHLMLKGKSLPLQVFEPLTPSRLANYAELESYCNAYQAMSQQSPDAILLFNELALKHPNDPLVQLHQQRLSRGEQGNLIVMTEK
ncbi:CHASE2 domain-containing protein [Iodobacter ciconiae]|uniref:Adenylate/guanylate cyclase domain-containing protein n=1 Tax=Iodobacter ciconiae TaxID=2496266 RepID=A0A3S8ZX08_9NEIS|nr:adenylate/guanylate cyclase domain-containing protein [Iodobacter ciconiae]AZN38011.1 adenylate/guanylate cyclase domain-containing protein [Iodobacter ciconiae]